MAIFVSPFLVFACFKMKKTSFLALGFFMLALNFTEFHEIGGSKIQFLFSIFSGVLSSMFKVSIFGAEK